MEDNYSIPRNIVEQFDIGSLMYMMARADWYYEYSDDRFVWEQGTKEIREIKDRLLVISKAENGMSAANTLWDAYAPVHSASKPDFLLGHERLAMTGPNMEEGKMPDILKQQAPQQNKVEQQDYSNQLKSNIMNEKNFDYLSKQIMYTGFGEAHKDELMQKMKENKPEFTIFHQQDFGKDNTVATLQFRRPEEGDMYFFNRYSLMLKSERHEDPIKQTFYINNDMKKKEQQDITLKEGYNLLSGRAVEKDLVNKAGEKYTAWVQLDFKVTDKHGNYEEKKFHQNYGFDLEKLLHKHPIKELNTMEDKKMLMDSLQRGNRQAVTFQIDGKEQRIFIEAAPQFKSINLYDNSMKRVNAQTLREGNGEVQTQQQDKKESMKVNNASAGDEDDSPSQSEKRGRKKGQKIS